MIDPDMDVPSWPLYSDAFVFDELTELIGNAHFCRTIFCPCHASHCSYHL